MALKLHFRLSQTHLFFFTIHVMHLHTFYFNDGVNWLKLCKVDMYYINCNKSR